MSSHTDERKTDHWQDLAEQSDSGQNSKNTAVSAGVNVPSELKVRLSHGVWFGTAMGIGFAIGFLISFMALVGFVAFVIYSRFPGLFS